MRLAEARGGSRRVVATTEEARGEARREEGVGETRSRRRAPARVATTHFFVTSISGLEVHLSISLTVDCGQDFKSMLPLLHLGLTAHFIFNLIFSFRAYVPIACLLSHLEP